MKKQILFSLAIAMSCCFGLMGQEKKEGSSSKESQKKETNLMDEQAKFFGDLFGDMDEDIDGTKDPFKNVKSYQDLLNKSNIDSETKTRLMAMYQMYDQSLDPKQKDSLKVSLEKMFEAGTKKPEKQN